LVLLFSSGEFLIISYCYGDSDFTLGNEPINPGYAKQIASVMSGPSPIGQYPYGDHQWSQTEAETFVNQAYLKTFAVTAVISLVYLLVLGLVTLSLWKLRQYRTRRIVV
jgi:hypothetical protein